VFLDRDGTLNQCFPTDDGSTTRPPLSVDELRLMPGAAEACDRLRRAGHLLLVVTNQPDVRRGTQTSAPIEAMNRRLVDLLDLDDLLACFHDDGDGCDCRKPLPGLILRLAARHDVDLERSWMVGDRPSDVAAGRAAGCATVLVSPGPISPGLVSQGLGSSGLVSDAGSPAGPDYCVPSLLAAADLIVTHPATRECA
jgi:D-glycero-D-manno-heptose 1,7-bisphosphate phosphatase